MIEIITSVALGILGAGVITFLVMILIEDDDSYYDVEDNEDA